MAGLEKMALRGIRSFSPDDEQTIEFYSPLTMIVGQNGSGKTTIIECLKYACTGKLPPGGASTAGQSWIHDPKLTDDTEVKASIKLRFKARDGKRMVVVRSLQLQYKGKSKNPTFKQLEGVIKTINPVTKKSESLGHKCQDLNTFVPQATGISTAILESVVFCHQEESSWPLQDGATLKKKFDDIFESTRYTKALEAIEKCRKVRAEEHKNLKLDLAALAENRETASDIRRELERKTAEIQEIQAKQDKVEERISTLQNRAREASRELAEFNEVAQVIEKKAMLVDEKKRGVVEKKRSLGTQEMTGQSDESLQKRLASFAKDQEEVQRELARLRQKEMTHKKAIDGYRAEVQKLVGRRGELKAQMKQLTQLVEDRNKDIVALCDKYALAQPRTLSGALSQVIRVGGGGGGGERSASASASPAGVKDSHSHMAVELPEVEMKRFLFDFQGKKENLTTELDAFRTDKTRVLNKKRGEMTELEATLLANETAKRARQAEMKEIEAKFAAITNDLHGQAAVPASVLEAMRQEVAKAKAEYTAMTEKSKEMEFEKTIKCLQKDLREVAVELDSEQKVWESMKESSTERTEYEVNFRDYTNKMEELKAELARFNSSLYRPLVPQDLTPELDDIQQAVTHLNAILFPQHDAAARSQARELTLARQRLTELATNQSRDKQEQERYVAKIGEMEKQSLVEKARRILEQLQGEFEEKIRKNPEKYSYKFDDREIDEAVKEVEQVVKMDVANLHDLQSKLNFAAKVVKSSSESRVCECCTSSLSARAVKALEDNMGGFMARWEDKANRLREETLPMHEQYLRDLQACTSDMKAMASLREALGEVEGRLKGAEEQVAALATTVHGLEEGLRDMEAAKKKLDESKVQVVGISNACAELYKKKEELDFRQKRLQAYSVDGDSRGLEEVETSLKTLRATQAEANRRLQEIQAEQSKASKRLINQADLVRAAETSLEAKLKTMSRSQELEKEKAALKMRQGQVEAEVQQATEEEIPLRQELKGVQADFDALKSRLDAEDADRQRQRIECTQRYQDFEALQRKVREMEGIGLGGLLAGVEQQQQQLEHDIQGMEGQLEEMGPQVQVVAKRLEDKDQTRRQIEDNLTYRRMQAEVKKAEEEMVELQGQLEGFEEKGELARKVEKIQQQWREARETKVRHEARIDTLAAVQQEQQAKLGSSKFQNIEQRYRDTKITAETTNLAVEDLQKYHKALDRALMQYHKMKIEEINKIIRELWTRTYQGNDIEEIAIVSGEDGGGKATRSYNYRVVMKKGQTLLDMRGRCSAGQRVLASIVIRLALAEAFCINCGVMTLDEPTTNLDHENKGGLAGAIARLIAERGRQQNFQLIVITHDEDFVDMVKQELSTQAGVSMPEYYWRVSREPAPGGRAYSTIQVCEWGTI